MHDKYEEMMCVRCTAREGTTHPVFGEPVELTLLEFQGEKFRPVCQFCSMQLEIRVAKRGKASSTNNKLVQLLNALLFKNR
jgi:hypothetical protein